VALWAECLVGAIGAAEQQKQGDQGVRHDRLLGKGDVDSRAATDFARAGPLPHDLRVRRCER
jgi:hypothetical protein